MLEYFNNETINGKLYINYPMTEGFKHIKTENGKEFRDTTYEISKSRRYKKIINNEYDSRYHDITSYTFEKWKILIQCY